MRQRCDVQRQAGCQGLGLDEEELQRPRVGVFHTGGEMSPCNMNLREQHGYAYGAGSRFDMRLSPGPFFAAAGVQTDKTSEALREFFNELNGIVKPVSQDELTQYLIQSSAQYGMAPQDFVNALQEQNQLPAIIGEVARNKALAIALGKVSVVDTNGAPVDLTGFVAVDDETEAEDEVLEEAEELVDAAAEADEIIEAEEAEAAPAKKPAKKK